jgi:hypothetical protein
VNSETVGHQVNSDVIRLSDGTYLIVWQSLKLDENDPHNNIYGQLYDTSFKPVGGEFRINSTDNPVPGGTFRYAEPRAVALSGGGFAVVWEDNTGLAYRAFDADGTPQGSDIDLAGVDEFFGSPDWQIDVASTLDDGFVVTFLRPVPGDFGSAGEAVFAMFVLGAADGVEVQVSSGFAAARASQIVRLDRLARRRN